MTIGRTSVLLALATLAVAAPALAQRPAGLFSALRADSGGRDSLTLQMAIREAFDSDVAPEFRARLPGGRLPGPRSNIFAAGMRYARNRRAVQLSATTTGFARYSYELQQAKPGAASAQLGIGLRMPGRLGTLSLSQGLSYSPSYLYQLVPDDGIDAELDTELPLSTDPDYRIDTRESFAHRTRLRLQTGAGLGWRMVSRANYARTDFRGNVALGERRIWDGGTRLSYHPTRRGNVSFGYRYRESSYRVDQTAQVHELPLGFDYTPALSPTRRLTLRVQVTPTLMNTFRLPVIEGGEGVDAEEVTNGQDPDAIGIPSGVPNRQQRRYAVQGEFGVSYPVSLRWHTSTVYQRRVQTLAILSEPVVSDGVRLRLAGVIRRRIDVAFGARYLRGASAAGIRGHGLTTAQGDVRLRFALTPSIALSAEYLYYRYDFAGRLLAPDLPSSLERHGVRVGVSMFTRLLDH